MTMKRTELEKRKGLKIANQLRRPARPPASTAAVPDRREQRERDRAAGLVPFAVKLQSSLVGQLQQQSAQRGVTLDRLVDELLRQSLAHHEGNP